MKLVLIVPVLLALAACQARTTPEHRLRVVAESLAVDVYKQAVEAERYGIVLASAGWPGSTRERHESVLEEIETIEALIAQAHETGNTVPYDEASARTLDLMSQVDWLSYRAAPVKQEAHSTDG